MIARIAVRLALGSAIWLAGAGQAAAQSLAERPPGQLRFGRLSVTPTIRLTNLGIDTNVFNTEVDRRSDFTFTVLPQAEGLLDLRRLRILVAGGADFVYFQKFESERAINPRVQAQAELRLFRRSAVFGQYSRADVRDRLNLEVDGRVRRLEETLATGVSLGVTRRLTVAATGSTERRSFAEGATFRGVQLRQTLDRETRSVDVAVQYALTSLTTVVFSGRAYEDRFQVQTLRDTQTTEFRVGAAFKPRALLAGSASVGYTRSLALKDDVPDFRAPVAEAELVYTLLESTQFGVSYERTKEYSFDPDHPYYSVDRIGGLVRRHLFGRVDLTVEAELQKRGYRTLAAGAAGPAERPDRVQRYAARLGVQVARRARVGVDAEYFGHERGRASRGSYRGLRVGLTASYGIFGVGERVAPTR